MKLKILEQEKDLVKIEIDQRDMTLLHPLVEELLKDKVVISAQYILGHPELDKPVLRVQVSSGKPTTAIKRAAKSLVGTFADLREAIEKEIK
jgi:DNA-directed RNA polymerase subunit L